MVPHTREGEPQPVCRVRRASLLSLAMTPHSTPSGWVCAHPPPFFGWAQPLLFMGAGCWVVGCWLGVGWSLLQGGARQRFVSWALTPL